MCALIFFHLCPCFIRRSQVLSTPMWPTMELWTVLMSLYLSFGISAPRHLLELRMEGMSRFEVAVREHQAHHHPLPPRGLPSWGETAQRPCLKRYSRVSQSHRFRLSECVGSDERQNYPLP